MGNLPEKKKEKSEPGRINYRIVTRFPFPYLLLFLASLILYKHTFDYPLDKLDESPILVKNMAFLKNGSNVGEAVKRDALMCRDGSDFYRPVQNLSFMLDTHISNGNTDAFHIDNFLQHFLTCSLIFYLLILLQVNNLLALLLSLFFCVNPLFTHAVVWIPSRGDLLVALFGVASIIFFIRYFNTVNKIFIPASVIAFCIAMFSKETAILIPVIIAAYIRFNDKKRMRSMPVIFLFISYALVVAIYLYARKVVLTGTSGDEFGVMPLIKNLCTIPEFVAKFFLPFNLSTAPVYSVFSTTTGIVLIIAWVGLLYKLKEKINFSLAIFGLIWFILFTVPGMMHRLHIGNLGYDYLEHRSYLPAVGFVILLASFQNIVLNKKFLLLILLIPLYAIITYFYSLNYENAIHFYTVAIEKNPKAAMSYYNRGIARDTANDLRGALDDFDKSIMYRTDYPESYYARGYVRSRMQMYSEAVNDYMKVIEYNPKHAEAYNNMGALKNECKDYEGAIKSFDKALEINGSFANAYFNRGIAKINSGDTEGACKDWKKASVLGNTYAYKFIEKHCK